MIASHIIELARAIRIEDEIAKRDIRLKGRIDQSGPCPVCGGRDRFAIHIRKQKWLCRHCGRGGGDVISLVQFIDHIGFVEAIELLSGEEARPQARPPAATNKQLTPNQHEREQHRKAAWLWAQRQPITGSGAHELARKLRQKRIDVLIEGHRPWLINRTSTIRYGLAASMRFATAMIALIGSMSRKNEIAQHRRFPRRRLHRHLSFPIPNRTSP
jgi:hypothetical protein